jgi:hypothetical protein
LERVSVLCAPGLDGDVSVVGYADGREITSASDSDGYERYIYAGLVVVADSPGAVVRFSDVMARVPDEGWDP